MENRMSATNNVTYHRELSSLSPYEINKYCVTKTDLLLFWIRILLYRNILTCLLTPKVMEFVLEPNLNRFPAYDPEPFYS